MTSLWLPEGTTPPRPPKPQHSEAKTHKAICQALGFDAIGVRYNFQEDDLLIEGRGMRLVCRPAQDRGGDLSVELDVIVRMHGPYHRPACPLRFGRVESHSIGLPTPWTLDDYEAHSNPPPSACVCGLPPGVLWAWYQQASA